MKTLSICFVALFAVAFARSVVDDVDSVNGDLRFDGNESNFGDENDKIVGGTDTTIERHPHQLSLRLFSHTCGGSIISPVRGLTAVSCIIKTAEPKNYVIYAGSTTVSGDDNTQRRVLSGFVKHPAYDEEKHLNNIAILFWEQPLTIGANVRPIRLPAANAAVPYGQKATTTGWGRTYKEEGLLPEILKEVSLPLIRNEDCNRFYSGKITPDMVCAGGEADRGICNGDGGGPLVHNNILIGITSWSRNCGAKDFPAVYVRVAFFIDWINKNIK